MGDVGETFFPLVDGARWNYRHSGVGSTRLEIVKMTQVDFEGESAFAVEDDPEDGIVVRGVLVRQGSSVARVNKEERDQGKLTLEVDYDPGFTRFDDSWETVGMSETRTYARRAQITDAFGQTTTEENCADCGAGWPPRAHRFTIEAVDEPCQAGGEMVSCTVMTRERVDAMSSGEKKRYWFARGIGKVKEENLDTGKLEELIDFDIP